MIKYNEFISEAKGDAGHHKYSKNTLEELELLLKHHKEDIKEYDEDGDCDKETILHDIEEIEAAIKVKKSSNVDEKVKVNTQAICDEAKKLSPENQAKVFAFVLSLED